MRINDIVTNKQYILYLNGKPVSTYDNLKDARGEVYVLQQNNPNLDYEIKQEVCREEPLGLTKNTLVELGISKTRTFQKKGVAEGMSVNDRLLDLWKNHGKAFNLLDYYTNDSGNRKKIQKYKQIIDQLESRCQAEFGSKVCAAMKKHTDAMTDSWYGQSNRSGELLAAKLRKQFGVNWDGQLNETEQGVAEGSLQELAPSGGEGNGPIDYGRAIVEIGHEFVDYYQDEGAQADAKAIIKVGQTFISAGMKSGIQAFYNLDTQIRDHVAEQLMEQGFNVKEDIYLPYKQQMATATAKDAAELEKYRSSPKYAARRADELTISAIPDKPINSWSKPGEPAASVTMDRASKRNIKAEFEKFKQDLALRDSLKNVPLRFEITVGGKPINIANLKEQGVAEGSLNEFAPSNGGGDGRWYTDDEIADIIGEEWFDFDLSGEAANISIRGEHAKILLVQEAQAYFEDMGYHGVVVQDVRDDEDYLSWYISGNFTRSGKGVAEQAQICSECGGPSYSNPMLAEKKDACYHKVKSRVKVWPSAYASGQLVQCRKRGASNWGTGGKKK